MFRNAGRRHRNVQMKEEQTTSHQPFFTKSLPSVVQKKKEAAFFQTKLSIGEPNDKYEKEADNAANAVVNNNSAKPVLQQKEISSIQRLATPLEDEKLGTNDARMAKDKEIQEKPELQRMTIPEEKEDEMIQHKAEGTAATASSSLSGRIENTAGKGKPLSAKTVRDMGSSFGTDFSHVNIHTGEDAVQMNKELNAQAFTHGSDIYFNQGKYDPQTNTGKQLLAHELTHVMQQQGGEMIQRQKGKTKPWIKKVLVNLTPPQSAALEWDGAPPAGSDSFTVSTGKGYSDPDDEPGTCLRNCCEDAEKQCDEPYNKPGKTGACCTYVGKNFVTGKASTEHNGWKWWTRIEPYYSKRGIALHQHHEVTGQPIGHGCVRMDEANAKRIYDYSVKGVTKVEISGRASPVLCKDDQKCKDASTIQKEIGKQDKNLPVE
jgi:Domain of unknown function (DUF4157)/L,D-transpeptidase catalytic domain